MNQAHIPLRLAGPMTALSTTVGLALALLSGTASQAAGQAASQERPAAIEARFQLERKTCLDGRSGQNQATCLKEAGAARADALHHRLDNGEDKATRQANALTRCAVQSAGDRAACEMLARGQGMESGSVRDGGVIKEIVTRSVGSTAVTPTAPAASATSATSATSASPASPASAPVGVQPTTR